MAELATAYISIVAETSGIPRSVRTALGATQRDADVAGRGVGRTFSSSFGTSIKGLGAAAGVTGGIAGVATAMKSAVTSGMDFTTSLNTLRSVAGASSQQVAQVGARARELGTDNQLAATSSVDAAQAMLELAKGGFTVDQSMQAARGTLQLAAAAQISAADAATIQSQALQAFGKDASFAGTASDILANAANQSSAEITDIANALQQGGAVANQFGLSMQDTAATVSLLANAGIQGSDAGTLLKSALLALTDTSKPAQAAMDDLGLTVYDAQGKFVGMESLFGQLQAASQRMTPQMYQQATATLFGSDAARIAGVAAQQGAVGFDKMRDAMGKQGAAAEVAAAKMNGLPGAWERFKNSAQDAGLAFYDAVQGPLTSAANWGADAIGKISDGASKLGPTVRDIFASISDAFTSAGGPEMVTDWGQRLMWVLSSLGGSAADLMPLVGNLFEMFGEASAIVAAVGIETFVTALETAAELLSATVVPVLQLGNSVLESMQPVVVGAIAAWLGWRLVGPALAGVRTQVTTLGATAATTSGRLMTLAMANRAVVTAGAAGSVTMGRFGSMIAQVGQRAPVVARMQQSFVQAAAGADRFGRSAGAVAAAGTGMRAAGAGIAGVFGGPVGLALTGAALGVTYFTSQAAKSKQTTEAYRDATKGLASAQDTLSEAYTKSRGAMNDDTVRAATSAYEAYRTKLGAAEAQRRSWYQVSQAHQGDLNEQADEAKAAAAGFDKLGLSNKEVAQAFSGTEPMYQNIRSQLAAMGDAGAPALAAFDRMRQGAILSQQAASRVKPGVDELGEAMRIMGDKGASAEDKLNALKAAMDAMNPARSKTEAMAQYGDTVRQAAEAVQQVNGTAFDQSGQLNAMTEAGGNLNRVLQDLADKSGAVATSGGNMGAVSQQNEQIFQQLAAQTGQSVESIRALYQSLGGQTVDLSVRLQGAPQVTQQLGAISQAWNKTPTEKTITLNQDAVNADTAAALQRMNINVRNIPGTKQVEITANDAIAQQRILLVTQNLSVLDALKANPTADLNTFTFNAKNDEARAALTALQGMKPTPQAGMIIQDLLNGQSVSMSKLDELARTTANPQAKLEIEKIMANIATVNTGLDNASRPRTANINAVVKTVSEIQQDILRSNPGIPASAFSNADGSVRKYVDGGIHTLERYANGGERLPSQAVVQKAQPNSLIQWAEPETGGEAFIPLAEGKRSRSTDILATVAKMFGYLLVPKDNLPNTLSGMAGAFTGTAAGRLLALTGMDRARNGVQSFANGGIRSADEINRFPRDNGLEGAPYVWGGVHWGDCSGAMSAIARYAVGLDPWGGRFATASEGSALSQMGFQQGRGSSGDLRIAYYNGGPGGGHTVGQLPDDTKVEMGGARGNGQVGGGADGPENPMFTDPWFLKLAPSWKDAGSDPGGFVVTADGGIEYRPGNGNYGASGSSPTGGSSASAEGESAGTSISTRLGSAVGKFFEGQVSSLLSVLSINDSPGALGAISEYENQVRSAKSSGSVDSLALKKSYETAKAEADKRYEAERLKRQQEYEAARAKLEEEKRRAGRDEAKRAETDRKLAELKTKHQNDDLAAKQRHDDATLKAKQKFDEVSKTGRAMDSAAAEGAAAEGASATDPGTTRPAPGQDMGGRRAAPGGGTGSPVKDAFRAGLRTAWQSGNPWQSSDWIVNKESSWNPLAENGKYFGLIQAGADVYAAAGMAPRDPDPTHQGRVFDKYVDGRYGDPMAAQAHHEANNWYDQGGTAIGTGLLAKNVIPPERVLSPRQTEAFEAMVRRDFQGGNDALAAKLDELIRLLSAQPRGQAPTYQYSDERSLRLAQDAEKRRINGALAGR